MTGTGVATDSIACPVCGGSHCESLITVPRIPVNPRLFQFSRTDALNSECRDIDLVLCADCGHIYNCAFAAEASLYSGAGGNALELSPRDRDCMEIRVDRLIEQYDLRHKSIVDMGNGRVDLLRYLCREGTNHGLRYDPSRSDTVIEGLGCGSMEIVNRQFPSADFTSKADAVLCRRLLEKIPDPAAKLRRVRELLDWGGFAYVEVPNSAEIFGEFDVWDLSNEQISYFSQASLARTVTDAGLSIFRISTSLDKQYLEVEAVAVDGEDDYHHRASTVSFEAFPRAYAATIHDWTDRLTAWHRASRRVVVWGAETRAVTFLNLVGASTQCPVEFVVDVDPSKAGRFIPGAGQQIREPAFLQSYRPDIVIVMNHDSFDQIGLQIREMRLGCDLVSASTSLVSSAA